MLCSLKKYDPILLTLEDVEEARQVDRNKLRRDATGNLVVDPERKSDPKTRPLTTLWKPQNKDSCWVWGGAYCKRQHYAIIYVDGVTFHASRFLYMLLFGRIERNQNVCHTCDNPRCVNPWHFFLGTQADNMQDCKRKGRTRASRGSENPHAKLTETDVAKLRATDFSRYGSKIKCRLHYGMGATAFEYMLKRKSWRHVP
jgi:hypothetical protein